MTCFGWWPWAIGVSGLADFCHSHEHVPRLAHCPLGDKRHGEQRGAKAILHQPRTSDSSHEQGSWDQPKSPNCKLMRWRYRNYWTHQLSESLITQHGYSLDHHFHWEGLWWMDFFSPVHLKLSIECFLHNYFAEKWYIFLSISVHGKRLKDTGCIQFTVVAPGPGTRLPCHMILICKWIHEWPRDMVFFASWH